MLKINDEGKTKFPLHPGLTLIIFIITFLIIIAVSYSRDRAKKIKRYISKACMITHPTETNGD